MRGVLTEMSLRALGGARPTSVSHPAQLRAARSFRPKLGKLGKLRTYRHRWSECEELGRILQPDVLVGAPGFERGPLRPKSGVLFTQDSPVEFPQTGGLSDGSRMEFLRTTDGNRTHVRTFGKNSVQVRYYSGVQKQAVVPVSDTREKAYSFCSFGS